MWSSLYLRGTLSVQAMRRLPGKEPALKTKQRGARSFPHQTLHTCHVTEQDSAGDPDSGRCALPPPGSSRVQAAAVGCLVIFLHRFATTALRAGSILPLIAAVTAHQAEQRCAAGEPGRGEGAAYKGTHKSLSPRGVVPRRGGRAVAAWTLPTAPRQAGTRRRPRDSALVPK